MKPVFYALAALTLLSACQRNADEDARAAADAPPAQPQVDAPVTPADQAAPLTYSRETAYADVQLTLPEAIAAYPDLHASIYGEEVRDLREFLEGAQSDHTEFGGEEMPLFEQTISFAAAGESPRLFSLAETNVSFTGGAHPNTSFAAVLWDKTTDRRIEPLALFRQGADLTALDQALCDAVNAAQQSPARAPFNEDFTPRSGSRCPRAIETPFVLEPSQTPGRAGGLVFYFAPFTLGPYAEGAYQVVVPQSAFRGLLSPTYAGEFAGAPRRTGDVTDRGDVTQAR